MNPNHKLLTAGAVSAWYALTPIPAPSAKSAQGEVFETSFKSARAATLKDWTARTYDDGKGHVLPYRLFVPAGYDAGKVPLVLFLHGAGGRGTDNVKQLTDVPQGMSFADPANQQPRPCFIVAPQCPEGQQWVNKPWSDPSGAGQFAPITWPMEATLALVDALLREYPGIDPSRLYIVGLSMGGYGTWDAVTRYPDKFKAAVPICGGGDPTQVSKVPGLKNLRLWAFHGADDPAVPVGRSREMIAAVKALGGIPPRYTEYPHVGHDSFSRTLIDIKLHEWLFDSTEPNPKENAQ